MKRFILLSLSLVALISCSPNVQLVTLRGTNVLPTDQGLNLDNDTLTLTYNFASERGQMHLTVFNKLNQPLYVDWKRSALIVGQNKYDYWYDIAQVQLSGYSSGHYYRIGSIDGTITKEDQVGFIPPQTRLNKLQFMLVPAGDLALSGPFTIEKEPSKVGTEKLISVNSYSYSAAESPLKFRNYLTLSTDKDFKTEFHIETAFWASDVKVLPREQLLSRFNGNYLEPVPFKKPDSFYVPITQQQ